ncbi:MAG: T9SS type A sorting domain-containing protein [Bacteroidota bacterium]
MHIKRIAAIAGHLASDRKLVAFTHGHGAYNRKLSDAVGIGDAQPSLVYLSVYPNPANDYVFIELKDRTALSTTVSVFDLNGKQVRLQISDADKIKIDVSDLPPGIYLAEVQSGRSKAVRKVVIQ